MKAANRTKLSIGSVQEWNDINVTATSTTSATATITTRKLPLLDLRNHKAFHQRHIKDAIHMPLATLKQRSYELPPRQHAFAVLVPSAADDDNDDTKDDTSDDPNKPSTNQEEAALRLVQDFFLCLEDDDNDNDNPNDTTKKKKKRRAQKPWRVPLVILAGNDRNWEQAESLGVLVRSGIQRQQAQPQHLQEGVKDNSANRKMSTSSPFHPLPRLWQPDSMVQTVLLPLLAERLGLHVSATKKISVTHHPDDTNACVYEIWDLGAGSGRDVCFLAEELKAIGTRVAATKRPSFCVVGMDQRYRRALRKPSMQKSNGTAMNPKKRPLSPDHNTKDEEADDDKGTKRSLISSNKSNTEKQYPSEEEECVQFWNRRNLKDVTRCASVQFENTNQGNQHLHWFQQQRQHQQQSHVRVLCLYMVRFWNQSLLEFLANHGSNACEDDDDDGAVVVVESGTLVAVSQFAKPSAGAPWPFEHPKVITIFLSCTQCFFCGTTHSAALHEYFNLYVGLDSMLYNRYSILHY